MAITTTRMEKKNYGTKMCELVPRQQAHTRHKWVFCRHIFEQVFEVEAFSQLVHLVQKSVPRYFTCVLVFSILHNGFDAPHVCL